MKIVLHRAFIKAFRRLPDRLKKKTREVIRRFNTHPNDPALRDHQLSGRMEGRRSFSVTADIRIIYREAGDEITVIFLDIGTHGRVYY